MGKRMSKQKLSQRRVWADGMKYEEGHCEGEGVLSHQIYFYLDCIMEVLHN